MAENWIARLCLAIRVRRLIPVGKRAGLACHGIDQRPVVTERAPGGKVSLAKPKRITKRSDARGLLSIALFDKAQTFAKHFAGILVATAGH